MSHESDIQAAREAIEAECDAVKAMLLEKNAQYGNSALDPVRVFSRASTEEQIRVRIDDKLSRLARGSGQDTEDVEADLMGYLVLLRVQRRLRAPQNREVTCSRCAVVFVTAADARGFQCPACGLTAFAVAFASKPPTENVDRAQLAALADHRSQSGPVASHGPTHQELVADFQRMIGRPAPAVPTEPAGDVLGLRLALIAEEFAELLTAALGPVFARQSWTGSELADAVRLASRRPNIAPDAFPAFVDALADLAYVIAGTNLEIGVDGDAVFRVVHEANMRKVGGPKDPVTGKHLKPPGWTPPDIVGELRRQGWRN